MKKLTTVMAVMSLALLANGVKHGPTMPPNPGKPLKVTHGPTMPPLPGEPVVAGR